MNSKLKPIAVSVDLCHCMREGHADELCIIKEALSLAQQSEEDDQAQKHDHIGS